MPSTSLVGLPRPQALSAILAHHSTAVTVTSASLVAALLLLGGPAAYRDYRTYMSYGPGGAPHNAFGWLTVTLLMGPLGRDMFGTAVYDRDMKEMGEGSWLKDLPRRKGARPQVGPHVVPQRQTSQVPEREVRETLLPTLLSLQALNPTLLTISPSNLERHTSALFIAPSAPHPHPLIACTRNEIAHVHGTSDHSVHVILSPADSKKVIDAGWGQRHALSGSTAFRKLVGRRGLYLPEEYVLVYAPRDEEEVGIVMGIVRAAVGFGAGVAGEEVK